MQPQRFDLPRYLSLLPLFQEMAHEQLQRIAAGARLRRCARGEHVFRVGEPCEEFHVTVTGQVKLYAISPAGQEKVIELIGPGSSFAEALMFAAQPYIVNAQTLAESLVLSVDKAVVIAEIERDPRFAMRMLCGVSRRLHGLVRDVQAYALHSGLERVVGYLLHDLPESQPHPALDTPLPCACRPQAQGEVRVSLPVSKATIASRLSLTPEYFSRVLRELAAEGLIEIDKRDVRIPDRGALARYPV